MQCNTMQCNTVSGVHQKCNSWPDPGGDPQWLLHTHNTLPFSTIQSNTAQYNTVWCPPEVSFLTWPRWWYSRSTVTPSHTHNTLPFSAIQSNTAQYNTVVSTRGVIPDLTQMVIQQIHSGHTKKQCNTIQYSAIQSDPIQYCTVWCPPEV